MAEFVSVNSGSGQGLGVKAAHSGINVRWEPSHVPETHPLDMVGRAVQIAGQFKEEFSIEVTMRFGVAICTNNKQLYKSIKRFYSIAKGA